MNVNVYQMDEAPSNRPRVSVTTPDTSNMDAWLENWEQRWDAECTKRRAPINAKRDAAISRIDKLSAELALVKTDLELHLGMTAELEEHTARLQSAVDAELEPLRAECIRRAENHDYGDKAQQLRSRRDALIHTRAMIGSPLTDYQRNRRDREARLRAEIASLNAAIEAARIDATSDAELLDQVDKARKTLKFNEDGISGTLGEISDIRRTRLEPALEMIEAESLARSELDAAEAELDDVQGKAFAQGREPDGRVMQTLKKKIEAATGKLAKAQAEAKKARAAVPHLEAAIVTREGMIERHREKAQSARGHADAHSFTFAQRLIDQAKREHEETLARIAAAQEVHFKGWTLPESEGL